MATRNVFFGVIAAFVAVGFTLVRHGYSSPVRAGITTLLISALPFFIIALAFEGRVLRPGQMFKGALYGDVFLLPIIAVCLAILTKHAPLSGLQNKLGWLVFCAVLGLVAGVVFHHNDISAYTRLGIAGALDSPTKLFHDYAVFPVMVFYLLSQAPVLFNNHSSSRLAVTSVAVVSLLIFAYLAAVYDAKNPALKAHPVSYNWRH